MMAHGDNDDIRRIGDLEQGDVPGRPEGDQQFAEQRIVRQRLSATEWRIFDWLAAV